MQRMNKQDEFRLQGGDPEFCARVDSLFASLDNSDQKIGEDDLESDEEELLDPIHTGFFQKERQNSNNWQFYSLKDVPEITEQDNRKAALSAQHKTQEYMLPSNIENMTIDEHFSQPPEDPQVYKLRKKTKKKLTLNDEGCEDLTLNL